MGRYFGIGNSTKKQSVSSYWKGDEWCCCYQVMHQFRWEKSDEICSGCYDTFCDFEYNEENDEMECVDTTEKKEREYYERKEKECREFHMCHICAECKGCSICLGCECKCECECKFEYGCKQKCECMCGEDVDKTCKFTKDNCTCKCENCNGTGKIEHEKIKTKSYGFDESMNKEDIYDMLNHVPDWDGNKCTICNYIYDELQLDKYAKKFDGRFFMN
jgi:hypothetical protein